MNKMRRYVKEFFSSTPIFGKDELKGSEITGFFIEIGDFDAGKMVDGLTTIFDHGYAKGYRKAMEDAKTGGAV